MIQRHPYGETAWDNHFKQTFSIQKWTAGYEPFLVWGRQTTAPEGLLLELPQILVKQPRQWSDFSQFSKGGWAGNIYYLSTLLETGYISPIQQWFLPENLVGIVSKWKGWMGLFRAFHENRLLRPIQFLGGRLHFYHSEKWTGRSRLWVIGDINEESFDLFAGKAQEVSYKESCLWASISQAN